MVLDKEGKLVRQIKSSQFANLLDITLSKDGKTLWVLSDQKLYKF